MVSFLRSPLAASFPSLPPPQAGDSRPTYDVGYTAVAHPPRRPFSLPLPTLDGRPVLEVKDVRWSLFYPCEAPASSAQDGCIPWVVGPLAAIVQGYSRFLGISKVILSVSFALLVGNPTTVLPDLHRNARLRSPPSLSPSASSSRWPLLVFSHGLGGGKHVYSQLSRYWASRGYVVLVLQHADGSGPATIVRNYATGEETDLPYIRNEELSWTAPAEETVGETKLVDVEPPAGTSYDDKIPLRRAQLEIRHAEVYEAFDAFKAIVCGEATEKMLLEEGLAASNWEGNVDVDSIYLGGHSFGGATSLHVLSNPPPKDLPRLPVRSVVLLDPWLDPLPPSDDSKLAEKDLPPSLVINSEGFTLWADHFKRLVGIERQWGGDGQPRSCWGTTILRSDHQSFSDFPLLLPSLPGLPFASKPATTPESLLTTIMRLSEAFLSTGSPTAAEELVGWNGACDEGDVAFDELPRPRNWRGQLQAWPHRRISGGKEGDVRVHFRGAGGP